MRLPPYLPLLPRLTPQAQFLGATTRARVGGGGSSPFVGSRTESGTVSHAPHATHIQSSLGFSFPLGKLCDSCIYPVHATAPFITHDFYIDPCFSDFDVEFCVDNFLPPSSDVSDRDHCCSHNNRNYGAVSASDAGRPFIHVPYQYTQDLLQLEACRAASAPSLPRCATTITTPLLAAAWEKALRKGPPPSPGWSI